ncbi:MAG: ABC transporter ATP-binding protein [Devosia marina]|jgi:ABC-type Fe3+/spermidine/putrescine transport system ATPase subunit|uniref:ATP-binding cassette domain-containing protein n=1 Tax=Devosia marina TaxID=2683198 RepID=A0A7X3FUH3_9HYPH|nr:ABC transporter ATP-binding protein [Devosia marina]MVT00992.1 ATP-binding cassette domain-containing protein [Devosia marina]
MANVRLTDIRKSFAKTQVLHGISLDIASGEFISLLGSSGCGKTTLLRMVAGLESVTAGGIEIDDRDVTSLPPEKRDIAMMFQSYALLPHLSVSENVRFPLRMRGIGSREEQQEKVAAALETVQLGHLSERKPRQLSGGQQQRVALARAIVSQPKVLLLDEPLSNLDARLREDMQVELIEIHQRLGLTTIFVTHDQEEALSLSDRIVLLNAGRVEQQGTPDEIYNQPATSFASNFIGSANLVPVEITDSAQGPVAKLEDGQVLHLDPNEAIRGKATLALRQEDLTLSANGMGLKAKVRTRVFLGARNRYVMSLAGHPLRALTANDLDFANGQEIALAIDPARIRVIAD